MPSDYMYDLIQNSRLFDTDSEWAKLGSYAASWKYVILITAMKLLYNRFKKLNFQYPGLRDVFESFRLAKKRWKRAELEDWWLDIVEGRFPQRLRTAEQRSG